MNEYQAKAWIDGHLVDVIASYDMDGYQPMVLGIFDESDNDVTELVHPDEYDRIYGEISQREIEYMTDAADYAAER